MHVKNIKMISHDNATGMDDNTNAAKKSHRNVYV